MAKIEILLPAMGEGIIDATLTKWLVEVGEKIEEDQSIVEVATDKVDSEIPAPQDGIIKELLFEEGSVPKVGETIAILEIDGEEVEAVVETQEQPKPNATKTEDQPKEEKLESPQLPASTDGNKFLSPLVRSIIKKESIPFQEIENIRGTSNSGRITKNDVINFLASRSAVSNNIAQSRSEIAQNKQEDKTVDKQAVYSGEGNEIIVMDRMRKLIAEHMVNSKKTSPHVTSFVEVDVTNLVKWREKNKSKFLEKEKTKLTFTPLFIEATVKALKDFPMVNVSVDDDKIILKKNINIGMATALPDGNLIVPVIKNADKQNLIGIASSVNDLADRARNNKLKPDEIQGGTFTITNFGSFGNITGTPIINQPQVAILGVGSIQKKPAVVETPEGDMIGIRHLMILSLSYDHRVVDGALGGMFLKRIGDYLEKFDTERAY